MRLINEQFKALSDPTRLEILRLLNERSRTAGEIAESFQMTKPSISHHLTLLKQADLITDERRGQFIMYSLNTTVMEDVMRWFLKFVNYERLGEKQEKHEVGRKDE